MTTANDLCSAALRLISSLPPGEGIPGAESDAALSALNMMLAAWSADNLMKPFRTLESFTLTAGQPGYALGQSGLPDVNTVRPDEVTFVYRRDAAGQDSPLDPWTSGQYNSALDKSTQGDPLWYYFDPQYPNATLYLYPAPSTAETLFVESLKPVAQFASLSADLALPGEYAKAIKYLLADELAPEYGFPIPPGSRLERNIEMSRKMILRKNVRPAVAAFDPALLPPGPTTLLSG